MKRFFKIPEEYTFSGKYILLFMLPIIFEQMLTSSLAIADTFMVSMLPDSKTALAGIANVSRIDTLFKQIFVALAAGCGIFVAQYLGAGKKEEANRALKNGVYSMVAIATALAVIMEIFKAPILNLLFGKVEEQVMQQSLTYYSITIIAYPFMALFNAGTASFRSMGKPKATFIASVAMMAINLSLKYVFLFPLGMGVLGAGLSLLIAYAITGVVMFVMLLSPKHPAHIEKPLDVRVSFPLLGKIYSVALPTGIENGLFQLGALILQTLVATLGTAAINANHLTNTLTAVTLTTATSFSLTVLPIVGRCMGAKKPHEAEFYIKHLSKVAHAVLLPIAALAIILSPWLVSLFNYDAETSTLAVRCMIIYYACTPLFYPEAFCITYALRSAGDTRFTMLASVSTMFLFRIGFAYALEYIFHLGILSIWVAMVSDWFIRGIIYVIRFRNGKWKKHNLIH